MKHAIIDTLSDRELGLVGGVHALEEAMNDMPEEVKLDPNSLVNHHFAPGVYAREMVLEKGTTLTGKLHKTTFLNIISKGRVAVSSVDGRVEYSAPCVFTTYPGTKRAIHALEDTVWVGIHVTEETDLAKIEEEIIAKDYHDPVLLAHFEGK